VGTTRAPGQCPNALGPVFLGVKLNGARVFCVVLCVAFTVGLRIADWFFPVVGMSFGYGGKMGGR